MTIVRLTILYEWHRIYVYINRFSSVTIIWRTILYEWHRTYIYINHFYGSILYQSSNENFLYNLHIYINFKTLFINVMHYEWVSCDWGIWNVRLINRFHSEQPHVNWKINIKQSQKVSIYITYYTSRIPTQASWIWNWLTVTLGSEGKASCKKTHTQFWTT